MIAVTGGTGFIGSHLTRALSNQGRDFTLLVRSKTSRDHSHDSKLRLCNFEDPASVKKALGGAATLIHVLGLINGEEQELRKVNVDFTRNLVQAAKEAGVRKIIFVSSAAAVNPHGPHGKTKREAEDFIKASGIPCIIFRPAYVYGEGDPKNTGLMMKTLKSFPMIPLLGGGDFKLQPVYVDDLISLLLEAIDSPNTSRTYNVAGPAQIPLRDMLSELAAAMKIKRIFVPVPLKPVQKLLKVYSQVFRNTKLPVKQILELDKHEAFDISETKRDFKFSPMDFKAGVQKMFADASCAV